MDIISQVLIEMGLQGLFTYCGRGVVRAVKDLTERCGSDKPLRYESVSAFWYDGVDQDGLVRQAKVKVHGVVSLFIPLCPRHPKAVPGKQVNTWIEMHNRSSGLGMRDFATQDFVLWNDGVLIPPKTGSGKAIIGLSDKYGYVGHGCLPLVVDLRNQKHKLLYDKLVDEKPVGYEAEVIGRLTPFTIELANDFGLILPHNSDLSSPNYPNFILEVFEIKLIKRHTILTGTMWLGYENENIYPIYCHLLDKETYQQALVALSAGYGAAEQRVIAVHDTKPFQLINRGLPELNENLIETFSHY